METKANKTETKRFRISIASALPAQRFEPACLKRTATQDFVRHDHFLLLNAPQPDFPIQGATEEKTVILH